MIDLFNEYTADKELSFLKKKPNISWSSKRNVIERSLSPHISIAFGRNAGKRKVASFSRPLQHINFVSIFPELPFSVELTKGQLSTKFTHSYLITKLMNTEKLAIKQEMFRLHSFNDGNNKQNGSKV